MNVLSESLHAGGELFGVSDHSALSVSLAESPAVVDNNVFVSGVLQTLFYDSVSCVANYLLVDGATESVP